MVVPEKTYAKNSKLEENPGVDDKDLALSLAGLRKIKGLTQTELADLVGCTLRTIQNLEAGKSVTDSMRKAVADALNYDLEIHYNLIPRKPEK